MIVKDGHYGAPLDINFEFEEIKGWGAVGNLVCLRKAGRDAHVFLRLGDIDWRLLACHTIPLPSTTMAAATSMLNSLGTYVYERRGGLKRVAGYVGGTYAVSRYIVERLGEVRDSMVQDRLARDK